MYIIILVLLSPAAQKRAAYQETQLVLQQRRFQVTRQGKTKPQRRATCTGCSCLNSRHVKRHGELERSRLSVLISGHGNTLTTSGFWRNCCERGHRHKQPGRPPLASSAAQGCRSALQRDGAKGDSTGDGGGGQRGTQQALAAHTSL